MSYYLTFYEKYDSLRCGLRDTNERVTIQIKNKEVSDCIPHRQYQIDCFAALNSVPYHVPKICFQMTKNGKTQEVC